MDNPATTLVINRTLNQLATALATRADALRKLATANEAVADALNECKQMGLTVQVDE